MRKVVLRMNEENKYLTIKKLVETNGNKKRAAVKLNCSVRTINRLIIKYKTYEKLVSFMAIEAELLLLPSLLILKIRSLNYMSIITLMPILLISVKSFMMILMSKSVILP